MIDRFPRPAQKALAAALGFFIVTGALGVTAETAVAKDGKEQTSNVKKKADKLTKQEKKDLKAEKLEATLEIPNSTDPKVLLKQTENILTYIDKAVIMYNQPIEKVEPWFGVVFADQAQRELFKEQLQSAKESHGSIPIKNVDDDFSLTLSALSPDQSPIVQFTRTLTVEYVGYNSGWVSEQELEYDFVPTEVIDPRTNESSAAFSVGLAKSISDQSHTRLSDQ